MSCAPEAPARTQSTQWECQGPSPLVGQQAAKDHLANPQLRVSALSQPWSSPQSHWVQRHLCSTLGSRRGARGCGRVWPSSTVLCTSSNRSGRHTVQMSSKNAITCSPALILSWMAFKALCCPKANNNGMRGSPCCAHLVLPQMCGWAPVETSHKGEDLISSLHPKKAFKHRVPRDQIVRTCSIDRHDGRLWVHIGERLQDVSDALTSRFGG